MARKKTGRNPFATVKGLLGMMGGRLLALVSVAVVNGSLGELLAIGTVLFGALAIGAGLDGHAPTAIAVYMSLAILSGALRGLLRYLEQYMNHYIAFTTLANVRIRAYAALSCLAPVRLEGERKGNLVSMVTSDTEILEVFYAHTISPSFIAINVLLSITLICGFLVSWPLAAAFAGFYAVIGFVFPWLSFRLQGANGKEYRREAADFSSFLIDSLRGSAETVFARDEKNRSAALEKQSGRLRHFANSIKWRGALMARLTDFFMGFGFAVIAAIAVTQVLAGQITSGAAAFGVAVAISSFRPAVALSALPAALTSSFAAANRILDLIAEKPAVAENTTGQTLTSYATAAMDKVCFAYPDDRSTAVLTAVDLTLPSQGVIAIVGESGAGKSTILKLLMRHWDPVSGRVSYSGHDARELTSSSLRDHIAIMDQDTYLFRESVRANLSEAKPLASEAEMWTALGKAAADTFVKGLKDGLDTVIDPDALNISSGERQRLGLARLFLRQPGLILLDEPTSNVDSLNEQMMLRSIKECARESCVLLVSHRLSTVRLATASYRLETGHLAKEKGR